MEKNNLEIFKKIKSFEEKIGISFTDINILAEALTHRSYLNENLSWNIPHNERLEFLGDAVLEIIVTDYLFRNYTKFDEGKLTSIRAALVNYQSLARVAKFIGLGDFILISKGEKNDVGKARDSILANACEALIGAIYIDIGYDSAKKFVDKHILSYVDDVIKLELYKDPKSVFQEKSHEIFKKTPSYKILEEIGPDHHKKFVVGVFIGDKKISEGEGFSKQEAEQNAAKKGMYVFKKN